MGYQEMRSRRRSGRGRLILWLVIMAALGGMFPGEASGLGWERTEDRRWACVLEEEAGRLCGAWVWIDGGKYHFDSIGRMDTGWVIIDGEWYFFCPDAGALEGRLMTGWQWIDGKCYYLSENEENENHRGVMYRNRLTPDGYYVGQSGAWLDAAGNEVYEAGKGILTVRPEGEKTNAVKSGGGGGTGKNQRGAGTGGRDRNGHNGDGEVEETEREEGEYEEREYEEGEYDKREHEDSKHEEIDRGKTGHEDDEYKDGKNGDIGNRDRETQATEDATTATPSEASRVKWEIRFVEQNHYENRIFRSQKGESVEGEEVLVDFPTEIVGKDGYMYRSAKSSPQTIQVSGSGIQKYYIEFIRGEKVPPKDDGEGDEYRARLERWLEAAEKADFEIAGSDMEKSQIITLNNRESDDRIKNLVSMIRDSKCHEIYLIAVNHIPSPLAAAETFSDVVDISVLVMDEFKVSDSEYCIVRIGLRKKENEETCRHKMETEELIPPGCISGGSQTMRCSRCGFMETVFLPPSGHRDSDGDGICDVCGGETAGKDTAEARHYRIGDIQIRSVGKSRLRFRCIDDDYTDGNGNNQSSALFLCDTVIRSDVDSDSSKTVKMNFGENNNYKTSNIRNWLNRNAADSLFDGQISYTGINTACTGMTDAGSFEQFGEGDLNITKKPFQLMEDKMFILSAEEAFRYREYLWKFDGSRENNPETQISPCSRGYYLRTPQYAGETEFEYRDGIYVVDLIRGNIHPVDTDGTDVGIRPAMTVRQCEM